MVYRCKFDGTSLSNENIYGSSLYRGYTIMTVETVMERGGADGHSRIRRADHMT